MSGFVDNLQSVFTNGLSKWVDAEVSGGVQVNQANDAYGATPDGTTLKAGQTNATAAGVPSWAWAAGGVVLLLGVLLVVRR